MSLSETIHRERYAQHGEKTWSDTAMRIAKAISKAEQDDQIDQWTDTFHKSMVDFDFIPGGRIISNAGKAKQYMMNCNLLDLEDSRESIGNLLKDILVVSGTGGGVGVSYSSLRPKGSPIQTSGGVSSGSISFMHCADTVAGTIKTGGGRRAALMLSLSAHHPDILDFLHEKLDLGKLNNANISVEIDQKFIEAVRNDEDWELIWAGKTQKIVKAREIWNILIKNALASGEPGIMNLGLMKELSNSEYFAPVAGTNPCGEQPLEPFGSCVTGDTKVFTDSGIKNIIDLRSGKFMAYTSSDNFEKYSNVTAFLDQGCKDVYRLTIKGGRHIKATGDHRILTDSGWKELQHISSEDKIKVQETSPIAPFELTALKHEMFGWQHGDGWFTESGTIGISFSAKDGGFPLKDKYLPIYHETFQQRKPLRDNEFTYQEQTEKHSVINIAEDKFGFFRGKACEKRLPSTFYSWTADEQLSFLRGLFGADGSVQGKSKRVIGLHSQSKLLLEEVQEFLGAVGIHSTINTFVFPNIEKYEGRKPQHDLIISKESAVKYMRLIGFSHPRKHETFNWDGKKKHKDLSHIEVIKIEPIGKQQVFDIEVKETSRFFANGIMIHNCCLGSVNIGNFAREKYLDVQGLKQAIEVAVRFLDNVISVNTFPLENIRLNSTASRRIGLGVTGLHYAMLKLGIKYGSDEGVAFTEKVYEILRNHSYFVSAQLADEKGAFPKFDRSKYLEAPFVKSLPTKIRNEIREKGIRNVCLNTQAPCGTTSILANVSSGIEPIFAPVYERRYRSHDDEGNEVTKVEVISDELFSTWIEEGKDISHFEGSHDVSPEWHIKVQEAAQRYIDSAVSKTVNLPKDYSEDDLSELLLHYMPNLKGITVYRDGSRGDSPLVPLDPSEYKNRTEDADDIGKLADCASGTCEI